MSTLEAERLQRLAAERPEDAAALPALRMVPTEQGVTWGWAGDENALDRMLWPVLFSAAELLITAARAPVRVQRLPVVLHRPQPLGSAEMVRDEDVWQPRQGNAPPEDYKVLALVVALPLSTPHGPDAQTGYRYLPVDPAEGRGDDDTKPDNHPERRAGYQEHDK